MRLFMMLYWKVLLLEQQKLIVMLFKLNLGNGDILIVSLVKHIWRASLRWNS